MRLVVLFNAFSVIWYSQAVKTIVWIFAISYTKKIGCEHCTELGSWLNEFMQTFVIHALQCYDNEIDLFFGYRNKDVAVMVAT